MPFNPTEIVLSGLAKMLSLVSPVTWFSSGLDCAHWLNPVVRIFILYLLRNKIYNAVDTMSQILVCTLVHSLYGAVVIHACRTLPNSLMFSAIFAFITSIFLWKVGTLEGPWYNKSLNALHDTDTHGDFVSIAFTYFATCLFAGIFGAPFETVEDEDKDMLINRNDMVEQPEATVNPVESLASLTPHSKKAS